MILRAALNGTTKTRIMYNAYLSYEKVQDYLKFLQKQDLLVYDKMNGIYKTTQGAENLLKSTQKLNEVSTPTRLRDDEDLVF